MSKQILDNTDDSREYKRTLKDFTVSCTFCPPKKGCNYRSRSNDERSWKNYRKTQYYICED